MADVKEMQNLVLNGETYVIKDAEARSAIEALEAYSDYLGVTTTALTDGSTTNPVVIDGQNVTAKKGNIVNYGAKEFIMNASGAWQEFGDLSALGKLAFVDSADVAGTAAAQAFTGTQATIESSGTYTPAGEVSLSGGTAQNVVTEMGSATTANIKEFDTNGSVTAGTPAQFQQGTDSLSGTYESATGTLTLNFSQGSDTFTANTPTAVTLPTSKETEVVTAQGTPSTGSITVPATATFTGTQGNISVSATYTPEGTNATSSVTGTASVSE